MLDEQMLKNYHNRRIEDLEICRKAIEKKDLQEVVFVGHKLKGNGEMFGYPELSKLGANLETAAKENSIEKVKTYLTELETWINSKK